VGTGASVSTASGSVADGVGVADGPQAVSSSIKTVNTDTNVRVNERGFISTPFSEKLIHKGLNLEQSSWYWLFSTISSFPLSVTYFVERNNSG
jgi:hypothetical protein